MQVMGVASRVASEAVIGVMGWSVYQRLRARVFVFCSLYCQQASCRRRSPSKIVAECGSVGCILVREWHAYLDGTVLI